LGGLVVHAGGWQNFKLRYAPLTAVFHDSDREYADLQAQASADPVENARVSPNRLINGGPPKDGIPSIDDPQFDTAKTTPFEAQERVIGVTLNGEAKAYPYGIMNWHEIVNDRIGGVNVAVSYCPLCDTILAFERGSTTYGVSGKLLQNCLVMYSRADDTLYAQPWGLGIMGPQVNQRLERIPATKTTLGNWLSQHPDSKILSTETGYERNYQEYPYGSYYTDDEIIFPARNQDERELAPKTIVTYVWEHDSGTPQNRFSGASHRFVNRRIKQAGERVVTFNGRKVRARWDPQLETVIVEELDGTRLPSSTAFAFVYPAYFGRS